MPTPESIPYGLRRYPLAMAMFGLGGGGFLAWASRITAPTFVFPFGTLPPDSARIVIGLAAMLTWVRFVRRPHVEIGEGRVVVPVGEFGLRTVELRAGDVTAVHDTPTPSGWRQLRIVAIPHAIDVPSARLPDDGAYARVKDAVTALIRDA